MQEAATDLKRATAPGRGGSGVRQALRAWVPAAAGAMLVVACAIPGLDSTFVKPDPPTGSSTVILTVGAGPTPTEAQGPQERNVGSSGPIPTAPAVEFTPLPAEAPPPPPPPPPPPAPTIAPAALEAATMVGATAQARATNVSGTATALPSQIVLIRGYQFEPATLSVPAGTVVQFRNTDSVSHQFGTGEMDSGVIRANSAWACTFAEPNVTHTFVSRQYPNMKMTITTTDPQQRPTVVRVSS